MFWFWLIDLYCQEKKSVDSKTVKQSSKYICVCVNWNNVNFCNIYLFIYYILIDFFINFFLFCTLSLHTHTIVLFYPWSYLDAFLLLETTTFKYQQIL